MEKTPTSREVVGRALTWLVCFLAISAAYLYTFPQPNIFYAAVVLLHALAGALAAILLVAVLFRLLRTGTFASRAGWLLIAVGAVLGLILIKTGTARTEWNKLYLHILISLAGVGLLVASWLAKRKTSRSGAAAGVKRVAICLAIVLAVLAGVGFAAHYFRK